MKLTISILIKTDMSKKLIVELENKLKDLESKRIKDIEVFAKEVNKKLAGFEGSFKNLEKEIKTVKS